MGSQGGQNGGGLGRQSDFRKCLWDIQVFIFMSFAFASRA